MEKTKTSITRKALKYNSQDKKDNRGRFTSGKEEGGRS